MASEFAIPTWPPGARALDLVVAWLARRSSCLHPAGAMRRFSQSDFRKAIFARLSDSLSYSTLPRPRQSRSACSTSVEHRGITRREGAFLSPVELLPEFRRTVHVRAWTGGGYEAACVSLAASRDEGFSLARARLRGIERVPVRSLLPRKSVLRHPS